MLSGQSPITITFTNVSRNARNGSFIQKFKTVFFHPCGPLGQISIFYFILFYFLSTTLLVEKRKIVVITTLFFPLVCDILMVSLTIVVTPFSPGRYPQEKNVSISLLSTILHLQQSQSQYSRFPLTTPFLLYRHNVKYNG